MRLMSITFLLAGALTLVSANGHDHPKPHCKDGAPISLTPDQSNYLYNRTYVFKELEPPKPPAEKCFNKQPYVRVVILFKRNPNVTEDYFHLHWITSHADLTIAAKNMGIQLIRYNQFHQTGQLKSQLGFLFNAGLQSPPYDGIAELFARDMEHFTQFMTKVLGDEPTQSDIARFVDTTQPLQVMAGYDNLVFGSAAPGMGGQDGILPGDDRLVYDCEEGN